MLNNKAEFRFYEELNDFLPKRKRKTSFYHYFNGNPTVMDLIQSLGIPHVEIDLILVNGNSVSFDHHIKDNDRVSVYPVFESVDISNVTKLRETPLRNTGFILDVHLGKLCRYLRLLGFDCLYRNDYEDSEIVKISIDEKRIILTRDLGILKTGAVTHGYWLRSQNPEKQVEEVLRRFDLYSSVIPFHRCMVCNGEVREVSKEDIMDKLLPKTRSCYQKFYKCNSCNKIYWKGSHFDKMKKFIRDISNGNNVNDQD